jgi:hypothetical protein
MVFSQQSVRSALRITDNLKARRKLRYQSVLGLNVETAWTAGTVFCGALVLNDVDLNVVRDRRWG